MNSIVTVASLAASTAVAAPSMINPDQPLMDLLAELKAAIATQHAADAVSERAHDQWTSARPSEPAFPEPPAELAEKWANIRFGELKLLAAEHPQNPLVLWDQSSESERDPVAVARWQAQSDALKLKFRVEEMEDEVQRCYDDKMEIYDDLMALPAQTPAGLAIKLEAGDLVGMSDDGAFIEHFRADIRRLAGQTHVEASLAPAA